MYWQVQQKNSMKSNEKNGKIAADAAESKMKAAEAKSIRDSEMSRKKALKEKRKAEELHEKSRAEEKASAAAQQKGAKEAAKLLQKLAMTAKAMVEAKCQVYQKTKKLYENAIYKRKACLEYDKRQRGTYDEIYMRMQSIEPQTW